MKVTPCGQLKPGDLFIRVGGRPVLITDVDGTQAGFYMIVHEMRDMRFPITRLLGNGHEIDLRDECRQGRR